MNNTELEMILQELLKEMQTLKSSIPNISKPSSEENGSLVSSQLEAVLKGIGIVNNNIKIILQKHKVEIAKIDYTPIRIFEEKLEEFKQIQQLSPPDQIIKHQHSFKNWQWLVVLFLFIGLSVLLGWYALDNYYEANDLNIKYEFVRKKIPKDIGWLDSMYHSNPEWVKKYEPSLKPTSMQLMQNKKHNNKRHK